MNWKLTALIALSIWFSASCERPKGSNVSSKALLLKEQERTGVTANDSITQTFDIYNQHSLEITLSSVGNGEYIAEQELILPTIENQNRYKFIQIVNPQDSMAVIFGSPEQFIKFMSSHNYKDVSQETLTSLKTQFRFERIKLP